MPPDAEAVFIHPSACVDDSEVLGPGTQVWHFCHMMRGAWIGSQCRLGHNDFVAGGVVIGSNVKIQNNVSLYTGCHLEDDVFCGPSCVFTNVLNPRSEISRRGEYRSSVVRRGATIGANATILCGHRVGRYAFVCAGAVVSRDVPDYALVVGVPARRIGWMSHHGHRLSEPDAAGIQYCPVTCWKYKELQPGVMGCLDCAEESPPSSFLSSEDEPSEAELAGPRGSGGESGE
jgi:UDP-2-acetamido-3-amino-2,3-dideoxy-glucuronate N-acetyltransferase